MISRAARPQPTASTTQLTLPTGTPTRPASSLIRARAWIVYVTQTTSSAIETRMDTT